MKLNLNFGKFDNATTEALDTFSEWMLSDIVNEQVIPFDSGAMQNEHTFIDRDNIDNGEIGIVTSTPYARRQYFHPEYNFQTANNPNAKGKWFEDWSDGGKFETRSKEAYAEICKSSMKGK